MEQALITVLTGLGYTAAWGGTGQGTALPRVVLNHVSGLEGETLLDGRANFRRGRIQVDVLAATYDTALTMARAIRATLSGYSTDPVWHCELAGFRSLPDVAGGSTIQRLSLDFALSWRE